MLDRVVSRNQIANSRMIPRETAGLEMRRDAGSLGARHAVDEDDDVRRDMRLAWPPRARLATPEKSESLPMPSQQRLGLDQQQGMPPLTVEAREQHEQASLVDAKGRALDGARGDDELLPKQRVLGDQLGTGAGQVCNEAARDARRTARVAERPHRPGCQLGDCCRRKSVAGDAEHGAIRADPRALIKTCSERNPERSCAGGAN
jgi:hypothetical protein